MATEEDKIVYVYDEGLETLAEHEERMARESALEDPRKLDADQDDELNVA